MLLLTFYRRTASLGCHDDKKRYQKEILNDEILNGGRGSVPS